MGFFSNLFGGGQAKAAKRAAEIQAAAAEKVGQRAETTQTDAIADLETALQGALGKFGEARTELEPFADSGRTALSAIQSVLGLSSDPTAGENVISALTNAPGYQFGMGQGVQALDRSAAARGSLYSGAQGKALTQFGQDYAGTQLNTVLDRISQLVSGGQNAVTNQASIYGNEAGAVQGQGQDKANVRLGVLDAISNAISGQAAAQAGGVMGAANAKAAGTQNALSAIGNVGKFFLGGGLKLFGP